MDDWEGEFPFCEVLCEAFIMCVLGIFNQVLASKGNGGLRLCLASSCNRPVSGSTRR